MDRKKVYYAHSMHLYGTAQEERDIETLELLGYIVLNPSDKHIQEQFRKWQADFQDKEYMLFFDYLIGECDIFAFRRHVDGKIPAGVWKEIQYAENQGKIVFELPTILPSHELSVAETRKYLELNGQR